MTSTEPPQVKLKRPSTPKPYKNSPPREKIIGPGRKESIIGVNQGDLELDDDPYNFDGIPKKLEKDRKTYIEKRGGKPRKRKTKARK